MSASLFTREKIGSHTTDFHDILYLSIFWKFIKNIKVLLKSDKDNE